MSTAYIYDDMYTYHEIGYLHPESPKRLLAIKEVLDGNGVGRELTHLKARRATMDELSLIHEESYIKKIEGTSGLDITHLDPDTSANRYTWEASELAAGGTIVCAEEVLAGNAKNAFAFVRPPGHHSEPRRARGFCVFNNIAIAAEWLMKKKSVEKIAIVDFDVHHGNGTQDAFYNRSDLLFVSSHRYPFFPGSGSADETGESEGSGYNFNIPMSGGADDDDYKRVFDTITKRVIKYNPDFILVSAGYDTHKDDPLGGMGATTACHRFMMRRLLDMAGECCDGKLVMVLEGGYNLKAIRDCVEVQLEEMVEG